MSERTFRAVVAMVLVGALALAAIVAMAALYRPSPLPPSTPSASTQAPTPTRSLIPSTPAFSGPAFKAATVISVGAVARGSTSSPSLQFQFVESEADAIPNAPGSFVVIIADSADDPSTVAFSGTPNIVAPGSMGATASFAAPNVLLIDVVASDPYNVEAITINGLSITASSHAAVGPMTAKADGFTRSLIGGLDQGAMPSPGTVVVPG